MDIPEFVCDKNPLGEHLNEYEMLSHLNSFSYTAIIGKSGSGKTSLLVSFLTGKKEKKVFRFIMLNIDTQKMYRIFGEIIIHEKDV